MISTTYTGSSLNLLCLRLYCISTSDTIVAKAAFTMVRIVPLVVSLLLNTSL